MCKFLFQWSSLLHNISIKAITPECFLHILGHPLPLMLHLYLPILGTLRSIWSPISSCCQPRPTNGQSWPNVLCSDFSTSCYSSNSFSNSSSYSFYAILLLFVCCCSSTPATTIPTLVSTTSTSPSSPKSATVTREQKPKSGVERA